MLNENKILEENYLSREKINFFASLIKSLNDLKVNQNIVDVYLNLNIDKMEIYIFTKNEDDFETEDFITSVIVEWEKQYKCFPETFINTDGEQISLLPRTAFKVC